MPDAMVEAETRGRLIAARRVARNTSVQAVGEVLGKIASLGFYAVMARELGQAGFGDFTFALSLALLCTVFASFGIGEVIARTLARDSSGASRLLTDAVVVVGAFGVAGAVVAVAIAAVGGYDANVVAAVAILATAAVVELLSKMHYATFQGLEDMRPVATSLLVQRISTAAVGIALLLGGAGLVTVALVYLGGALLAQVHVVFRLGRRRIRVRREASLGRARTLLAGSIALGMTLMLNTALFRIDATMLSAIKGNADVGVYGAAYRLLESTLFLSYAFVTSMLPALARLSRTSTPTLGEAYEAGCKLVAIVLLPLGTGFVAFAEPIVRLIYSSEYDAAITPVRLLGGAVALYGVSYLASHVLIAQGRQRVLPWATGVVLAVNVGLNLFAIPKWAYDGAAAVTSISEALLALILVLAVRRIAGSVSVFRVFTGPLAGCAAIAAAAALPGPDAISIALAAVAYPLVLLLVERRLFPADVRMVLSAVRR
jgi:O-antigen/teichoic acid export membrane protein